MHSWDQLQSLESGWEQKNFDKISIVNWWTICEMSLGIIVLFGVELWNIPGIHIKGSWFKASLWKQMLEFSCIMYLIWLLKMQQWIYMENEVNNQSSFTCVLDMCTNWLHGTVETLYNTIDFCSSTHKRHSIARPKGRGMGCLLWVQRATYCVDLSKLSSIKYLL